MIQKLHNFVHLNLCIALSLGLLLFLTGVQTATANEVSTMSLHTHTESALFQPSNWHHSHIGKQISL